MIDALRLPPLFCLLLLPCITSCAPEKITSQPLATSTPSILPATTHRPPSGASAPPRLVREEEDEDLATALHTLNSSRTTTVEAILELDPLARPLQGRLDCMSSRALRARSCFVISMDVSKDIPEKLVEAGMLEDLYAQMSGTQKAPYLYLYMHTTHIYILAYENMFGEDATLLEARDRHTGQRLWRHDLRTTDTMNTRGNMFSAPVLKECEEMLILTRRSVYIGAIDHHSTHTTRFDLETGQILDPSLESRTTEQRHLDPSLSACPE